MRWETLATWPRRPAPVPQSTWRGSRESQVQRQGQQNRSNSTDTRHAHAVTRLHTYTQRPKKRSKIWAGTRLVTTSNSIDGWMDAKWAAAVRLNYETGMVTTEAATLRRRGGGSLGGWRSWLLGIASVGRTWAGGLRAATLWVLPALGRIHQPRQWAGRLNQSTNRGAYKTVPHPPPFPVTGRSQSRLGSRIGASHWFRATFSTRLPFVTRRYFISFGMCDLNHMRLTYTKAVISLLLDFSLFCDKPMAIKVKLHCIENDHHPPTFSHHLLFNPQQLSSTISRKVQPPRRPENALCLPRRSSESIFKL